MDIQRAKQILKLPDVVQVSFQGAPVWIENIKDNNTAEVTNLETRSRMNVPVDKLTEGS